MNNQMPYFMPVNPNMPNAFPENEMEKINNKLNRLEKNIRILENRIAKLENENNIPTPKSYQNDDPTDMYII